MCVSLCFDLLNIYLFFTCVSYDKLLDSAVFLSDWVSPPVLSVSARAAQPSVKTFPLGSTRGSPSRQTTKFPSSYTVIPFWDCPTLCPYIRVQVVGLLGKKQAGPRVQRGDLLYPHSLLIYKMVPSSCKPYMLYSSNLRPVWSLKPVTSSQSIIRDFWRQL